MPASRMASATWSWARASIVGDELVSERGHRRHRLHRLLRGRHGPPARLHDGLSAALHRGDGRQEPGHRHGLARTSTRPPRASCARPSASVARSARPTAASTSSARSTTSWCDCWSRRPSSITIGDPLAARQLAGPPHRPGRRRPPPAGRGRGPRRRHRLLRRRAARRGRPGPRLLRRADGRGPAAG